MTRTMLAMMLPLLACGTLRSRADVPPSLVCDRVLVAGAKLQDSLARAGAGDCVIVGEGTYAGSFVLPSDVSLAASDGALVVLQGDGVGAAVLTIAGGRRSTVMGLHIDVTSGNGIAIEPGPANLIGVTVSGATGSKNALTATCTVSDCDQREVLLQDSTLSATAVGVLARGAWVRVANSHITGMKGSSLSDGSGVVATSGSHLSMTQVTVDQNQNIGVLLDGAQTRATIDGSLVNQNAGRGLWVQGIVSDAGVTISGTQLSGNTLLGLGTRESSGVVLNQVTVEDTLSTTVYLDIAHPVQVGDGLGIFTGSHDVLVQGLIARRNARAQVLADECGANVVVTADELSSPDGGYRMVVQRTSSAVDLPPQFLDSPGTVLVVNSAAVSAP